ncbi:MAG: CAP domain-containing protein [Steroidobacterales bacterium]
MVDTANGLREQGCGGRSRVLSPLRRDAQLDAAARNWSRGVALRTAIAAAGYREVRSSAIHLSGEEAVFAMTLQSRFCAPLSDATLRDIGSYRRGREVWLIAAAPLALPPADAAAVIAARALALTNAARAQRRHCGSNATGPAPPLRPSPTLDRIAAAHAQDMLAHDYFAHTDPGGRTPADRVRAGGYSARMVGENIAFGALNADEVVRGWLDSPGHCQNIMEPRFTAMGLAYAANPRGAPHIYWVQLFAVPR